VTLLLIINVFFTGAPYVPESCCRPGGSKPLCTGVEAIVGPPTKGPPMESSYVKNEYLYTEGCYEKVIENVERNALILGGVAALVPLILVGLCLRIIYFIMLPLLMGQKGLPLSGCPLTPK